jgi:hypothetical protein
LLYQASNSSAFDNGRILIGQAELSSGITKEGIRNISRGVSGIGNGEMGSMIGTLLEIMLSNPGKLKAPEILADELIAGINNSQSNLKLSPFDMNLMRINIYLNSVFIKPLDEAMLKRTLNEIEHAIQVDPGNEQIHIVYAARSAFHEEKRDNKAAKQDFDAALKAKDHLSEVYKSRGLTRLCLKNKVGALADLQAASQIAYQQEEVGEYQEITSMIDQIESKP